MAETLWRLEQVENPKFPYRLTISKDDELLLALRVQDKWPGQQGHVFCLRETDALLDPPVEILETVPVVNLRRYGKRLAVVLKRGAKKRCDFLFLTKNYRHKKGTYEQIFWRTQSGMQQRKPRVRLTTYHAGDLQILIDTNERYPWRFESASVSRESLPAGDYALRVADEILAVVERKTFTDMQKMLNSLDVFHQQLTELESYSHSALLIEAGYSDFLNPQKMKYLSTDFAGKAIAEVFALHPRLAIVFAGNRKLARAWTLRFFGSIKGHHADTPHAVVKDAVEKYGSRGTGRLF